MNVQLKSIIALASVVVASAAMAQTAKDQKCGAGSCSKKEATQKVDKEASCSKKEASCSKKEASCSKKEASCSKK